MKINFLIVTVAFLAMPHLVAMNENNPTYKMLIKHKDGSGWIFVGAYKENQQKEEMIWSGVYFKKNCKESIAKETLLDRKLKAIFEASPLLPLKHKSLYITTTDYIEHSTYFLENVTSRSPKYNISFGHIHIYFDAQKKAIAHNYINSYAVNEFGTGADDCSQLIQDEKTLKTLFSLAEDLMKTEVEQTQK